MKEKLYQTLAYLGIVGLIAVSAVEVFSLTPLFSAEKALRSSFEWTGEKTEFLRRPVGDELIDNYKYGDLITVAEVLDGDTIVLENGRLVRYIGIDTPEMEIENENEESYPEECYATEATEANRSMIEGRQVRLFQDVSTYDHNGRLLAYVYRDDGVFVNLELVKNGFAVAAAYPPDTEKAELFSIMEREARSRQIGLWRGCLN